jgi:hypothetical protein
LLDSLLQGLLRLSWGRDRRILRRSASDNHSAEGDSTQRRAFSGRHICSFPQGPEGIEAKSGPQVVASQGVATARRRFGGRYGCAAAWREAGPESGARRTAERSGALAGAGRAMAAHAQLTALSGGHTGRSWS